jgi:hypothetical protein
MWLPPEKFASLRDQYLAWIESRLKSGHGVEALNRELRAVGLLAEWPSDKNLDALLDEMDRSHAGYLEPIFTKAPRGDRNVLFVAAGMYRGAGCSLDVAAAVYQRRPWKRLAVLNAGDPEYAFHLSGVDAGVAGRSGERILATAWVASNCTSTWNGKRIRIDRTAGTSIIPVLAANLNAQDRFEGEAVGVSMPGNIVTFLYRGPTGDGDLISGPSIARYRVAQDRAVREAPIALTRAGFLQEWLNMDEAEALRWGTAQAAAARASISKDGFEWARIAQCAGSPAVWEVGIRPTETQRLHIFRIQGSRARELRMLGVTDHATESCVEEDLTKGLRGVAAELPR